MKLITAANLITENEKLKQQRDELLAIAKQMTQNYRFSLISVASDQGLIKIEMELVNEAEKEIAKIEKQNK